MIIKSVITNFSTALNVMFNPEKHPLNLKIWQSIWFFYKILPIPILVLLLISGLDLYLSHIGFQSATFWSPSLTSVTGSGSIGSTGTPLIPLSYLLTYPIVALLNAGIFHLVSGKLFRIWPASYSKTLAAVISGFLPVAMLLWILSLPLANPVGNAIINIAFMSMYLWNAVITVKSLSVQHGISPKRAFLGFFVGMLVIFFSMTFYYNFNITYTITRDTLQAIIGK